ncbi:uncharacterized protein RCO7_01385 [Rhynchosporium graminicola]|uniref:Uncharacterized protein n=1 Tax=Rhynchosporium graminicola TaxID=2792576 RepID=A0A1E1K399_9HELO|nr:uncharacterized protein RCO7_01385 [Rhynchosporium commune]
MSFPDQKTEDRADESAFMTFSRIINGSYDSHSMPEIVEFKQYEESHHRDSGLLIDWEEEIISVPDFLTAGLEVTAPTTSGGSFDDSHPSNDNTQIATTMDDPQIEYADSHSTMGRYEYVPNPSKSTAFDMSRTIHVQNHAFDRPIPQMAIREYSGIISQFDLGFESGVQLASSTYNASYSLVAFHQYPWFNSPMEKALAYVGYLGTNHEVSQLDSNIYGNEASAIDLKSHAKAASGLSHSIQDLSEDARMMSRMNSQYKEFDSFQDDPVGWNVFSRGPENFHIFCELPLELRTMIFVEAANATGFVSFKINKSLSICQESQRKRPLIEK